MSLESKLNKNRFFNGKTSTQSKRWLFIVPFILLSFVLVFIPLIMIVVKTFSPTSDGPMSENWTIIDLFIWQKIIVSLVIAIVVTIVCIIIAYPFAYFLASQKSKLYKALVISLVTTPIWTSFLVKLIGLKTFFDVMYGVDNSTYGNIYTIIGLVYLYVPFMIMPIYSVLIDMPNNLINASHDLGHSGTSTFFKIVVPYTKTALISGITLVFLPTITTVAVPQFLNNANNGTLIGDIIVDEGQQGLTSDIALARASTLSLVLCGVLIGGYVLFRVSYSRISRHFKKQKVKAYA